MTDGYIMNSLAAGEVFPVFRGLEGTTFSGKEIANIVGVSPPTVSKWRKGKARPCEAKLVLLTLVLAHWIEETETRSQAEAKRSKETGYWNLAAFSNLQEIRHCLELQEAYNIMLSPHAVRDGARLFRAWWAGGDSDNRQDRHYLTTSIARQVA